MTAPNGGLTMPALALRGLTVFPNMLIHFDVGREASIKALDQAITTGQDIFLVAQRDLSVERPGQGDLYEIGCICTVRQILRLPGDNVRVMVEGVARGRLLSVTATEPHLTAVVEELPAETAVKTSSRTEALIRQTYSLFESYIELAPKMTPEVFLNVLASDDPGYIADYIAQNIAMRSEDKQAVLEQLKPVRRLELLCRLLRREVEILQAEEELQSKVRDQVTSTQREYFLREQLKVIQNELGEGDGENEFADYRSRIRGAKLPAEVEEKLLKEVSRLEKQPFGSSEGTVIRNYLDVCLELPWGKKSRERVRLSTARKILDADHYGLTRVKERILEFLAVKQIAPDLKGQIICLVGPPGVGKTSIAMSVARALNRKLVRISLGGVHDEAEIRGHRKTYIGAMPGRVIAALQQAGVSNPLMVLDEIDKLGSDHRGDPASALLEVLDSEQNGAFRDHFLEVPYDLSDVMFITTANTTDTIPRPLLDRMELIELTSYTDMEKVEIAKGHLLPRALKRHGLKKRQLRLTDGAIRALIRGYTREAGVRQLERELGALCRKTAVRVAEDPACALQLTEGDLAELLGTPRYTPDAAEGADQVGVVNGLAWTSAGGELLEVEVNVVPGSGKLELTGNLGDVMKESARAALSYIRSRCAALGIDPEFYQKRDVHIHFPEGAVPKDGPSAGIAITTAAVSALTGIPVKAGVAMTGEVTLRGRVLPIGGLKEKTMAALRSGIHTVILPAANEKDLEEIDPAVRAALRFVPVKEVDSVLAEALRGGISPQGEAAPLGLESRRGESGLGLRQ